uniref:Uncharacterized protein n=2 Tax=Daucus carota subsp. sativus TaxID=79200 RepID=A0A175YM87_DAUCS
MNASDVGYKVSQLFGHRNFSTWIKWTSDAVYKWVPHEKNPSGKVMATFMSTPPVPTFVAFYPRDYNIVAVGM